MPMDNRILGCQPLKIGWWKPSPTWPICSVTIKTEPQTCQASTGNRLKPHLRHLPKEHSMVETSPGSIRRSTWCPTAPSFASLAASAGKRPLRMPSKLTCKMPSEKTLTSKMKDPKKIILSKFGDNPNVTIYLSDCARIIRTSKYDARRIPFQYLTSSNYSDVYTILQPKW